MKGAGHAVGIPRVQTLQVVDNRLTNRNLLISDCRWHGPSSSAPWARVGEVGHTVLPSPIYGSRKLPCPGLERRAEYGAEPAPLRRSEPIWRQRPPAPSARHAGRGFLVLRALAGIRWPVPGPRWTSPLSVATRFESSVVVYEPATKQRTKGVKARAVARWQFPIRTRSVPLATFVTG